MNSEFGIQNIEISGRVIHGDGYGKLLGFPTANLDRRDFSRRKLKIRLGVYSGYAEIEDLRLEIKKKYKAAVVLGPLDKKGLPKIEAHLLGFTGNLYGKSVSLRLGKYLRPFKKYKNVETLKAQIARDVKSVKEIKL